MTRCPAGTVITFCARSVTSGCRKLSQRTESRRTEAAADTVSLFNYGYNNFEKAEITHPDFPDYIGTAVMKKGYTLEDLTVTENLDETAEEGPQHLFEYYDGDQKVGEIKVPEEVYQAYLDEQIEIEEPAEEEPEITETPEPTPTPPPVEERKRVEFPRNFSELMVWLDDGANRLLFILVILIILALILAIVLWIKQLGRRIRRRKRRKQLRKKKKEMERR